MHVDRVNCVAFSPDGRRIASSSFDLTILVWDAVTGDVVAGPSKGHTSIIVSVSFSPDGKRIASSSWDHTIRVWDARTGGLLIGPLTGHTDFVTTVTFSGDGHRLVSGSHDETVRAWSSRSGRPIHELEKHTNSVEFVAFVSNGERIVSADNLGDVCVWEVDTGTLVSGPSNRHAEGTLALVFTSGNTGFCAVSPDGNWIAGRKASNWTTVEVWDSMTGRCVATFSGHTDNVVSVSFSSDSKWILSVSNDTNIQVDTLDC
jgi:WD40 repeat protein